MGKAALNSLMMTSAWQLCASVQWQTSLKPEILQRSSEDDSHAEVFSEPVDSRLVAIEPTCVTVAIRSSLEISGTTANKAIPTHHTTKGLEASTYRYEHGRDVLRSTDGRPAKRWGRSGMSCPVNHGPRLQKKKKPKNEHCCERGREAALETSKGEHFSRQTKSPHVPRVV